MSREKADWLEAGVDAGSSAVYAGATAFALLQLNATYVYAAFAGMIAFVACLCGLRSLKPEARAFPLSLFEPAEFKQTEPDEPDELVLTDADRLPDSAVQEGDDALLLDDILAELGPDSRVVRLFDRSSMPTAGQLKARIDRHLDEESPPFASPDASQALYDALAELRRSLK